MVGTALSTLMLFVLATFYVYYATKTEIHIVYSTKKPEGEIGMCYGCLVIIMSSCVLVLLYYFADKFIFQIIFTCLIFSQITLAVHLTLRTLFDYMDITRKVTFTQTMLITKCNFDICSCIILLITITLLIIYWYTKHWILNNIFSFCLCYTILSLYHFTSFRMCLIFLTLSFIYDVFWVYISPALFSGNVMVFAATSVDLPIKLEVPVLFNNNASRNTILLGLGDIVIPGFTIKFLKRFDFIKKCKWYYDMGMKMYFVALVISGAVAFVFNAPQPVLFYMCPCLVVGTLGLAYKRGEVKDVMFSDKLEQQITMDISRERTVSEDNEGDVKIEMGECEGKERRKGSEDKRKRGWRRMKGRKGYKRKRVMVKEISIEEEDENEFEEIEDNEDEDDDDEECDYEQMGEKRRKKRRYI